MAISSSQSTGKSESRSDTYIPEYSEGPILREIAQHARAMSDVVYNWGMEVYGKNQGNIDALMRTALSYASPQRIAADMGMAEAGVMQAGERGRLSAERDLFSYGLDPSAGRYAALNSANRVMTAAAAAGAGNQQRMATEAAGNAMRNQAISAGLQNANFGVAAGESANRYLQTASSLKYPPLGRWSESTSEQQSTSNSSSESGSGGGSKQQQPKEERQPQEKGGGQPRQPSGGGPRAEREAKPPPGQRPPPQAPQKPQKAPATGKSGAQSFDEEGFIERYPGSEVFDSEQELPGPFDSLTPPDEAGLQPPVDELTPPDEAGLQPPANDLTPPDEAGFQPPPDEVAGGYNPYGGDENVAPGAFDPGIGVPTSQSAEDQQIAETDPAGSLYGLGEAGGWTGDIAPAGYSYETPAPDNWSDIGQGTMEQPAGEYDSTYDAYADDPYAELGIPDDPFGDLGAGEYEDVGYENETGGGYIDYDYGDYGDYSDYDDPYSDWSDQDYYGDEGDYDQSYDDWSGDEDYYDDSAYDDSAYDDYGDESYDDPYAEWGEDDYYDDAYGDDSYEDYSDDSYEDYADEDYYDESYDDTGDYEDTDYSDDGGGYEPEYSEGGGEEYEPEYEDAGDYGGEYARGGSVGRQQMPMRARAPGGRPRPRRPRPMTGYRQGPPGGMMAPGAGGLAPRPTPPVPPPGVRIPRPQQAPRPPRGAPMAAPGGPRPTPIGRGPQMPGNFISPNGMPAPTTGGMMRPQRMAGGGGVRPRSRGPDPRHATSGGFVSRELSPSGGSQVDDVDAKLNAEEFVIPKDVAMWKGKEFFYKMIAQARKNRSGGGKPEQAQTGYGASGMPGGM